MRSLRGDRGMSLIDVLIGVSLMLIIFVVLAGLMRSSLTLASLAKTKSVATSVAESQMEYIRSLSYDNVGTVGGIPAGGIPQYATTTSNGLAFATRTFIEYVDDPADGLENADENGITTDYKRIKVSVSYTAADREHTVDLISNYAPPGLETTVGGGTLRVDVVNALGGAVAGALVTIENPSLLPAVDVTTFSNTNGQVYLPGAPASTDYRIQVTKAGYSSAQTYERNATNQNPTPGYLTVAESQTTSGTFAIDVLATLALHTFSPIATTTWTDSFNDGTGSAGQSNVSVGGGSVTLVNGEFGYTSSGTVRSVVVSPDYLAGWAGITVSSSLPGGTSVRVQVLDGSGALLPESALPGNGAGFSGDIDLSSVNESAYPSLALLATLETSSDAATPALLDWTITYQRGPVPLPNIAFSLTGAKVTGTTGAGAPLYKTEIADATDGGGNWPSSIEWDEYQLAISTHDVVDACMAPPYVLSPGETLDSSLILDVPTTNMLLVTVQAGGAALPGAGVTLSRTGYNETVTASDCGGAYFGDVASASDYVITASAAGYIDVIANNVSVSGTTFYEIILE